MSTSTTTTRERAIERLRTVAICAQDRGTCASPLGETLDVLLQLVGDPEISELVALIGERRGWRR